MSLEFQHLRKMERLELEKLKLQMENELLRRLPSEDDKCKAHDDFVARFAFAV